MPMGGEPFMSPQIVWVIITWPSWNTYYEYILCPVRNNGCKELIQPNRHAVVEWKSSHR